MILFGAIGDAYGAGFEFADSEFIKANNDLREYVKHPVFGVETYQKYTDDTQMALAISELLIEGQEFTPINIANKFVEVFKRDPRQGYAKGFYEFLTQVNSGQEFLDKIRPNSEKNGSVMRVYPIGMLYDEQEVLEKAAIQSRVTHDTQNAIAASQAIALAVHFLYNHRGDKNSLLEYLGDVQKVKWHSDWRGEVACDAIQTVNAVFSVLLSEQTASGVLKKSVSFGGDTDTVASLALVLASLGGTMIDYDLPAWMQKNLENGNYVFF